MIKAKFYIATVSAYAVGNGSVVLNAVSRGAGNASWAEATPNGKLEMTINNPPAFDWFRDNLGREVYLDFTLAPTADADPTQHEFIAFHKPGHYNDGRCEKCGVTEEAHNPG